MRLRMAPGHRLCNCRITNWCTLKANLTPSHHICVFIIFFGAHSGSTFPFSGPMLNRRIPSGHSSLAIKATRLGFLKSSGTARCWVMRSLAQGLTLTMVCHLSAFMNLNADWLTSGPRLFSQYTQRTARTINGILHEERHTTKRGAMYKLYWYRGRRQRKTRVTVKGLVFRLFVPAMQFRIKLDQSQSALAVFLL